MLKKLLCILSIILFFSSCENIEITHPGNNQDLDPKPPSGDIEWSLTTDDENRGLLEENSQAGKTIGILNATDPNPDDEFTYQIGSQKMDNTAVNYFVINSVSGVTSLELANKILVDSGSYLCCIFSNLSFHSEELSMVFKKLNIDLSARNKQY